MSTHSSASTTSSSSVSRTTLSQQAQRQQAQRQQKKKKQEPNLFQKLSQNIEMAKKGYEQLVHAIIRPPRANYTIKQLGPTNFTFCGQEFQRNDVELITPFTKTETVNNEFKNNNNSDNDSSDDDDSGFGEDDNNGNINNEDTPPKVTTTKQLRMQVSVWTRCKTNSHDNNNKETKEGDDNNNVDETTTKKHTTFIVFMHGNASAKTEVIPQLGFLLAQGLDGICSFDFSGSGLSEGEYVSLGYYERFDLECVLQYLQNLYSNEDLEIILWGRSMGASTALMYASEITTDEYQKKTSSLSIKTTSSDEEEDDEEFDDPDYPKRNNMNRETSSSSSTKTAKILVKGLICDSPFASLPILCEELVEKARSQGIVVPGVIVSVALAMISRSVKHYANFDIRDINPLEHTPTINIPALFIVGSEDDFIPPHHSEELIASFKSGVRTNLFMVPGGHNDARPPLVYEAVSQFIQNRFTNSHTTISKQKLDVPTNIQSILHSNPPWAYSRYPAIFTALKQRKTPRTPTTAMEAAAAAAAASGTMSDEQEGLGMTQERVDDIQNKLHQMLGHGAEDII